MIHDSMLKSEDSKQQSRSEASPEQKPQENIEVSILRLPTESTPEEIEKKIDTISKSLGEIAEKLKTYHRLRRNYTESLAVLGEAPWWAGPIDLKFSSEFNQGKLSLDGYLTSLYEKTNILTSCIALNEHLCELHDRLGLRKQVLSYKPIYDLSQMLQLLQASLKGREKEAEELALALKASRALLAQIATMDPADSALLLEQVDGESIRDLLMVLTGRSQIPLLADELPEVITDSLLLGVFLSALWQKNPLLGLEALLLVNKNPDSHNQVSLTEILAFLDAAQLCEAASASTDIADYIVCALVSRALCEGRDDLVEVLAVIIDKASPSKACSEAVTALCSDTHREGLPALRAALRASIVDTKSEPIVAHLATKWRDTLLRQLSETPTLQGHFLTLRVTAQLLYMKPLKEIILSEDAHQALSEWTSKGSIDDMVEGCVQESGLRKEVEMRHRHQTRRFLQAFDSDLREWVTNESSEQHERSMAIVGIYRHLNEPIIAGKPESIAIRKAIYDGIAGRCLPFFGERIQQGEVQSDWAEKNKIITPFLLYCWPEYVSHKRVSVSSLTSDLLRKQLLGKSLDLDAVVSHYLKDKKYQAAYQAAQTNPELLERVSKEFESEKSALCERYARALTVGQQLRDVNEDVLYCLQLLEAAWAEMDIAGAQTAFDLLDSEVAKHAHEVDPRYRALVELLLAAGQQVDTNASLDHVEAAYAQLKKDRKVNRSHILALESIQCQLTSSTGTMWQDCAAKLDHPKRWPEELIASDLTDSLVIIGKFISGKSRNAIGGSAELHLVACIMSWVCSQLNSDLLGDNGLAVADRMGKLAKRMEDFAPDSEILQFVGGEKVTFENIAPPVIIDQNDTTNRPQKESVLASETVSPELEQVEFRTLMSVMDQHEKLAFAEFKMIREAAINDEWARVASIAATIWMKHSLAIDVKADMEAVFSVGILKSVGVNVAQDTQEFLSESMLAILKSRRVAYHTGIKDVCVDVFPGILAGGLKLQVPDIASDVYTLSLDYCSTTTNDAPGYLWLTRLLRRSSNVRDWQGIPLSARLGQHWWDALSNRSDSPKQRARLLEFLFRHRQSVALARLSELSPLADQIGVCLKAFEAAESNPGARSVALQVSAVLRNQSQGKANTQPWIQLMHTLESAKDDAKTPSVFCELATTFVSVDEDGGVSIEVCLRPSLFDPPESLFLQFGDRPASQILEGGLFTERLISVPVHRDLPFDSQDFARLPYRLTGETLRKEKIDIRGAWRLHKQPLSLPLNEAAIRQAWPGLMRSPVSRERGFYGRQREIKKIESYLCTSGRMRSVMVFGERRIGKTSLLLELVKSMPPVKGKPCAVFADMQGATFEGSEVTMAERFFAKLLSHLNIESDNESLIRALTAHSGHRPDIRRLGKGLEPKVSLFSALEGLAEHLNIESGGVVHRLVLVIDEFDRFVEPLLQGRRKEVDSFLWDLRQVIQRSERVTLILAGSGLQRLLKQNYDDALFGSIDELEIPRFNWNLEDDRDAITKIVLPLEVRDQICAKGEIERVAEHAARLCDGHPMFLSFISSIAAHMAKGRLFTPTFLDWVADRIIKGDGTESLNIGRKDFYAHQLNELDCLDQRGRSLAKSLWATVARYTTTDFPWLDNARVFDLSGVQEFALTRELINILNILDVKQAIEIDRVQAKCRIRVPITAAALREEAPAILESERMILKDLEVSK